jgi:thiol-disulfide isomerase/thioredoxin
MAVPGEKAWALAPIGAGILSWSVLYNLSAATSGEPLPAFALRAPDGTVESIKRDGRPIVINLWASWCPPCRREMPTLVTAAAVNGNVQFLFLNQGESADTVEAFFKRLALKPDGVLLDPATSVMQHYQAAGLPMTMFFNGDGRLAGTHVGEISREELSERLRRLDSGTRPDPSST